MKLCPYALVLFFCLFTPQSRLSAGESMAAISYNVQLFPPLIGFINKRGEPNYRLQQIVEAIAPFDVIALQELFHSDYREQLIKNLSQRWNAPAHSVYGKKPAGFFNNGFLTSSGCVLVSRFPIAQQQQLVFEHRSRFIDYGFRADGLAAKGVLHARLIVDKSLKLDVYVTHLEARDETIRLQQFQELADFIHNTADRNNPLLLLGDMNTRGNLRYQTESDSPYQLLLQSLRRSAPGLIDIWPSLHPLKEGGTSEQSFIDGGRRIDYIMLANPPDSEAPLLPQTIRVEPFLDSRVEALSDHNAVIAEFSW